MHQLQCCSWNPCICCRTYQSTRCSYQFQLTIHARAPFTYVHSTGHSTAVVTTAMSAPDTSPANMLDMALLLPQTPLELWSEQLSSSPAIEVPARPENKEEDQGYDSDWHVLAYERLRRNIEMSAGSWELLLSFTARSWQYHLKHSCKGPWECSCTHAYGTGCHPVIAQCRKCLLSAFHRHDAGPCSVSRVKARATHISVK